MQSGSASAPIASEEIHRALLQAEQPLKTAALSKLLKQKSGKAFKSVLDAEVAAGNIFSWGAGLYWAKDATAVVRTALLQQTANEVLATAALTERVRKDNPALKLKFVRDLFKEMVREKLLGEVALPAGNKKGKVVVNFQSPTPYLELRICSLLAEFGVERSNETIRSFLRDGERTAVPSSIDEIAEVAERIFTAMTRIAFAPGTSVTFYRLRQQADLAHIPKPIFDKAALTLQDQRRALLAEHDHAPRLPEAERDELVTDGLGTYYVSIYERRD